MTSQEEMKSDPAKSDPAGSQSLPAARRAELIRSVDLVFPNDINHYGILFGGKLLQLMDKAAFMAGTRFAGEATVLACLERVEFRVPIRLGDAVEVVARVVLAGRTSVVVRVDAYAGPPTDGNKTLCTTGYMTMVAVNEEGVPVQVPPLELRTAEDRREFERAKEFRETWKALGRSGTGQTSS